METNEKTNFIINAIDEDNKNHVYTDNRVHKMCIRDSGDDDLVIPIAMMGAPTVLAEKGINGSEYKRLYDMVSQFYGKEIKGFFPIEAGGVNSMLPIAASARLGIPLVDVDGMGPVSYTHLS